MPTSNILKFPTPEPEVEPSAEENLRGIWMSLRYLEEEAKRAGQIDLTFLIGLASMQARDLCQPDRQITAE